MIDQGHLERQDNAPIDRALLVYWPVRYMHVQANQPVHIKMWVSVANLHYMYWVASCDRCQHQNHKLYMDEACMGSYGFVGFHLFITIPLGFWGR